jgi:hypothetical protein
MKPLCSGLLIGALLWCVAPVGAQAPQAQNGNPAASAVAVLSTVTLSNDSPAEFFPVAPSTVAGAPRILNLRVSKVVNPDALPIVISAYLSPAGEQDQSNPRKILVGSFTVNSPDQPGNFILVASNAFRQMNADAGSGASNVRLLLEMKLGEGATSGSQVAVTIASPIWRNKVHEN